MRFRDRVKAPCFAEIGVDEGCGFSVLSCIAGLTFPFPNPTWLHVDPGLALISAHIHKEENGALS